MELYFTNMDLRFIADEQPIIRKRAVDLLVASTSPGLPFLLERSGAYATDINAWLRSLPSNGVRSPHSWSAYARDVKDWGSFLESKGANLWDASEDDLEHFHRSQRLSLNPVSAGTWVRKTYAILRLYEWALGRGLIRAVPFSARRTHERASQTESIRFVSRTDYMTWRDVGLRGQLPRAVSLERSVLGNVERNVVFADLLVTTGLRLREGSYSLLSDLPVRSGNPLVHQERWRVPPGLAKGAKERHTLAPVRVLTALDNYIKIERKVLVRAALRRGAYVGPNWIFVSRATADTAWPLDGSKAINLRNSGPDLRSRLLICDGVSIQPLMIFLNENGLPMSHRTWESIFQRATNRCAKLGKQIHISPHVLRHTFATWTLTRYLRQHIRSNQEDGGSYKAYLLAPVRRLMRLMGHSSSHTTFKYLDLVGDVPELLDEALDDFGLGAPELLGELIR